MKIIALLISAISLSLSVKAQWNEESGKITTSDNVGIGTTSPNYKLDISEAKESGILFRHLTTSGVPNSGNRSWTFQIGRKHDFPNRALKFGMFSQSFGSSPSFYVEKPNGYGRLATLLTDGGVNDSDEHIWSIRIGRRQFADRILDIGMVSDAFGSNPSFYVAPKGNEVFRITENGNVGIGSTNPGSNLEIKNSQTTGVASMVNLKNSNSDVLSFKFTEESIGSIPANYWQFRLGGTGNHHGIIFSHLNETPLLSLNKGGTIGIGTIATGGHKLAVHGSIGAREIKVETKTWSDFVFDDKYELRSLKETEQYINKNKHLPEIPSEAEVKENGINLGEMDAKLLQKIEELTLYVIEQNKQNQVQQALIEQLQKEVSALKEED